MGYLRIHKETIWIVVSLCTHNPMHYFFLQNNVIYLSTRWMPRAWVLQYKHVFLTYLISSQKSKAEVACQIVIPQAICR